MKSSEAKRKAPSKAAPKTTSRTKPARSVAKAAPRAQKDAPRAQKEARSAPAEPSRAAASDTVPMPDLSGYGVAASDARAHVSQCEPCGRAHKHVVKNPKDLMALESFGRHVATCLAGKHAASVA